MPFYLTRFSYTPATWAKIMKNPEDRRAAAKQDIESVGGKLHGDMAIVERVDVPAVFPDFALLAVKARDTQRRSEQGARLGRAGDAHGQLGQVFHGWSLTALLRAGGGAAGKERR